METYDIETYLQRKLDSGTKVLLVNAPVVETRYQWVRWNQPLDLLKLGTRLREDLGCDVKLFDFMLPQKGKVLRTANRGETEIQIGEYSYTLWRYGKRFDELAKWLEEGSDGWFPDEVWLSTLTSYWWIGIRDIVNQIQTRWPDLKVCVHGRYPTLEVDHARRNSFADALLTGPLDLHEYRADFGLYAEANLDFRALDVRSIHWVDQVIEGIDAGVSDYVFFNDDILTNAEDLLLGGLRHVREVVSGRKKTWCRFHGICGIEPAGFTPAYAKELLESGFVSLHFEHARKRGRLDAGAYRRVKEAYAGAGGRLGPDQYSGFINIGLPDDDLERIVGEMLNLHEVFATVILKPYSPTPLSKDYTRFKKKLPVGDIEKLSPHCFPFSQVNGISHAEYEELYALAAMLNHKVRNKGFDHFPGTLAHEMIRTSFQREVWSLGDTNGTAD